MWLDVKNDNATTSRLRPCFSQTRLVEGLLAADTSQLKTIIESLTDYRKWVKDDLAAAYAEHGDFDSIAKLHAGLAMVSYDDEVLEYLKESLLKLSTFRFWIVRDLLNEHKANLIFDYWRVAKDAQQDPSRRFRAACVLATYDPENEYPRTNGVISRTIKASMAPA